MKKEGAPEQKKMGDQVKRKKDGISGGGKWVVKQKGIGPASSFSVTGEISLH